MTFQEAVHAGKPAFHRLEGGTVLRYEAVGHSVQILGYPATPGAWRDAAYYDGTIPDDGWTHHRGCNCRCCR